MGKRSRNKGAAGERELIRMLHEYLGDIVQPSRNLNQCRDGGTGADVAGIPGWAVECKRGARYLSSWWRQTIEQAGDDLPALAYRLDRKPWIIEVRASDVIPALTAEPFTVSMPLACWCAIVRESLE